MFDKDIEWDDTKVHGRHKEVGADFWIEDDGGNVIFHIEWTRYGEPGYGRVNGNASSIEEAKQMVEAILDVRAKHEKAA